jgi:hypothetical protein
MFHVILLADMFFFSLYTPVNPFLKREVLNTSQSRVEGRLYTLSYL